MKRRGFVFGFLIVCTIARAFAGNPKANVFQAVDIYVDSGTAPLAAYQIEFKSKTSVVTIPLLVSASMSFTILAAFIPVF